MTRTLAIACSILLAACAEVDEGGPVENFAEFPPPATDGLSVDFEMPEWTVPAGTEKLMCWVPDWSPETDLLVRGFNFEQGQGGHHLTMLRTVSTVPPGEMWDCTSLESMTGLEPLVITGDDDITGMPEGFAFRMDQAAQLVVQSHYVNYSSDDWLVRDWGRLLLADPATNPTEVGYLVLNHGTFELPQGEVTDVAVGCTLPGSDGYNFLMWFGHMHELGTDITISANDEPIYEEEWELDFRDLPPIAQYDQADPLTMAAGDRVQVDCTFHNVADHDVGFPEEMCVGVSIFWPVTDGNVIICGEDD